MSNTVSLAKRETVSLEKNGAGSLRKISMGLGWDPAGADKPSGFFGKLLGSAPAEIDLDASCVVLDGNKRPVDLVWFRQLKSNCGNIVHSGDNRTGQGAGDDEVIKIDLIGLSHEVQHLVCTVNSFTGQDFNQVANAYCRITDDTTGQELARFNLSDKGSHTGVIMAYLSRTPNGWTFTAVGSTCAGRTVQDIGSQAAAAVAA